MEVGIELRLHHRGQCRDIAQGQQVAVIVKFAQRRQPGQRAELGPGIVQREMQRLQRGQAGQRADVHQRLAVDRKAFQPA